MQDCLVNELQMAFEKLTNQARFVQMIINKELVVSNRKKVQQFRPFLKTSTKTTDRAPKLECTNWRKGNRVACSVGRVSEGPCVSDSMPSALDRNPREPPPVSHTS